MLDIKSALILREKTLTHYDRMIAMVKLTKLSDLNIYKTNHCLANRHLLIS